MHETVASQLAPAADLPCADPVFLEPLKRSADFSTIRDRVVNDQFHDSWQEDSLHFFVFELLRETRGEPGDQSHLEPPVAVFVMHPESSEPVSAVVVTPLPGGAEAEVRDLREPDSSYVAPVS
jgi:hypothetical protein